MRKPLLSWIRYRREHIQRDDRLKNYLISGWGRKHPHSDVIEELKDASARSLFATNTRARLALTKAILRQIRRIASGRNAAFVTLAPARFVTPLSRAASFDPMKLTIWAEELLAGYNFIGAVDLALYINLPANIASRAPSVAWHVHLLVWDFDEGKLQEVLDRINDEERSFVSGRPTAHMRLLRPSGIKGRVAYMMKAPLSEYMVYPRKEAEDESGFDGPVLAQQGRTEQRKRPLRPGNAIKLCHALSGRTLPSLMVSGGAGSGILGTALTNAKAEIRESDESKQRKLERLFN
jgi:hypothetical protein